MSINQVGIELLNVLKMKGRDPKDINQRVDEIYRRYGFENIERWRNQSNKKNTFLHELVEAKMAETIQHIVTVHKFPINTERNQDRLTAYGLAIQNNYKEVCKVMEDLGAEEIETVDVNQWSADEDKEKSMNMVWVDLEMTSIEDPKILECAVIITDKDLKELDSAEWVIHFEKQELDGLGQWHQEHFGPPSNGKGGNDLFADCIKSKLTNDYVENALLTLLKKYCPEGKCSLAGSSIHTDKLVLKTCMPKVHNYLHYRIIDVSSIQAVMKRWASDIESKIKNRLANGGQGTVNHRAMDDIRWSISYMKAFRKLMIDAVEASSGQRGARGGAHVNNRGSVDKNNHHRHSPQHHDNHQHGARGGQRRVLARQISEPYENVNIPQLKQGFLMTDLYKDEKQVVARLELEQKYTGRELGLPDKDLRIYNENPHLREIFCNGQTIQMFEGTKFTSEQRCLQTIPSGSEPESSTPSQSVYCTTEHWGQRKLILTEIEFLTKYTANKPFYVIYAGAAPGWHIQYLSELFPKVNFILYDEKSFPFPSNDRIKVRGEPFTEDLARQYYKDLGSDVLFICDIRSTSELIRGPKELPDDMSLQLKLHQALRPRYSLLYLRISREHKTFRYPEGDLIIEPWSSRKSSECRLVIEKDAKMTEHRSQDIQNSLNHFQNFTRTLYYPHDMDRVTSEGLDHCYDCRAEINILGNYLTKIQGMKMDQEILAPIANLSKKISRKIIDKERPSFLNIDRTLAIVPKK